VYNVSYETYLQWYTLQYAELLQGGLWIFSHECRRENVPLFTPPPPCVLRRGSSAKENTLHRFFLSFLINRFKTLSVLKLFFLFIKEADMAIVNTIGCFSVHPKIGETFDKITEEHDRKKRP
jgi:hypothetical protein